MIKMRPDHYHKQKKRSCSPPAGSPVIMVIREVLAGDGDNGDDGDGLQHCSPPPNGKLLLQNADLLLVEPTQLSLFMELHAVPRFARICLGLRRSHRSQRTCKSNHVEESVKKIGALRRRSVVHWVHCTPHPQKITFPQFTE